jgi:hypothetical protein
VIIFVNFSFTLFTPPLGDYQHRLLEANFIEPIAYPTWLANVVMVQKRSGKWRMCIDFTSLNKACPKDNFPCHGSTK